MYIKNPSSKFANKVWITVAITSFVVLLFSLFILTFDVILLVFAAVIVAVFFRGLSSLICRTTGWPGNLCLVATILLTIFLTAGFLWVSESSIAKQATQFEKVIPLTIKNAKDKLNQSTLGKRIVKKLSSNKTRKDLEKGASKIFKSTFGVFGDIYVIFFLGIFFTISPAVYKKIIILLLPNRWHREADNVLLRSAENLSKWLKGQLFAMFVVFVLTATGLLILGIKMWLVLALIAGILNFIPNFGPLIAMIPAVLVGLLHGPGTAAIVAGLYIFIQVVESNFITPMVQKKLLNTPPAIIILAQLFIAPLSGGWGLVLATPIMVLLMTFIIELYVKKKNPNQYIYDKNITYY